MENSNWGIKRYDKPFFYGIVIIFFLSLLFASQLKVYSFFMDDLVYWKFFKSTSFVEFIFNTLAFKFRPVANFFQYVGFFIINFFNNTYLAEHIILFFFSVTSVVIYYIFYRRCNNIVISISLTFLFIISRFSYYSVGQYFGIMEDLGIIFSIMALDSLINFYDNYSKYKPLLFMLLAVLCHERYISLFFVYMAYFIMNFIFKKNNSNKENNKFNIIISIIVLIAIILLRRASFGNNDLAGTGGTNVLNTLNLKRFFIFFVKGLINILGLNWGDEYLYGISLKNTSPIIIIFTLISIVLLIIILINGLRKNKNNLEFNISFITIILFIFTTLFVACITIRVEMRFLYTPFLGILYLVVITLGEKVDELKIFSIKMNVIIFLFILLSSIVNIYYRFYWDNIYFVRYQKFFNFIYSDVVKKYGNEINNRPIIFLEDPYIYVNKDIIVDFLSQYYDINNLQLLYLNNIAEAPKYIFSKNAIVLLLNQKNTNIYDRDFVDLTLSVNLLNLP